MAMEGEHSERVEVLTHNLSHGSTAITNFQPTLVATSFTTASNSRSVYRERYARTPGDLR
jgi:hypothetical protein